MPVQHWTKIYTKNPYCIFYLGPYASKEQAQNEQAQYIAQLESEGKTVVSCFHVLPASPNETLDSCALNHTHWLQDLMADQLHLKVTYTGKDKPTVLEHHSTQDAYLH